MAWTEARGSAARGGRPAAASLFRTFSSGRCGSRDRAGAGSGLQREGAGTWCWPRCASRAGPGAGAGRRVSFGDRTPFLQNASGMLDQAVSDVHAARGLRARPAPSGGVWLRAPRRTSCRPPMAVFPPRPLLSFSSCPKDTFGSGDRRLFRGTKQWLRVSLEVSVIVESSFPEGNSHWLRLRK